MGSAFHHELFDPKPGRKRVERRQSAARSIRLSPRVKGKQINISVTGLGFIRQRKRTWRREPMPWEDFSFLFNGSDDPGIILYGDRVRWPVKFLTFTEIRCVAVGP
jgi:hypothetical protein